MWVQLNKNRFFWLSKKFNQQNKRSLKKKHLNLHLSRLFCWNHTCYCVNMVSAASASRYITTASRYHPRYQSRSSMYTRGLIHGIPRYWPRQFRLQDKGQWKQWSQDKTSADYLQHLYWRLTHIPRGKGAHLWIDVDFNLPDINWDQETVLAYANSASVSILASML